MNCPGLLFFPTKDRSSNRRHILGQVLAEAPTRPRRGHRATAAAALCALLQTHTNHIKRLRAEYGSSATSSAAEKIALQSKQLRSCTLALHLELVEPLLVHRADEDKFRARV